LAVAVAFELAVDVAESAEGTSWRVGADDEGAFGGPFSYFPFLLDVAVA
jgi:hypothetical protein